jgi:transposase
VSPVAPDLPDDPVALKALAVALKAQLQARDLIIEALRAQLAALRRARFGASSEKLDRQIEQLELSLTELEETVAQESAREEEAEPEATQPEASEAARRRPRGPRKPLPANLPREIVRHEPPAACPCCGGTKFSIVGEDVREVLDVVPAQFKVIVHVRPKVSCRACEAIAQAPSPSLPIERALPGPGLLAQIAIGKFCDHLPLYRQSEAFARAGLDLDRALLAEWMGRLVWLLEPLAAAIGVYVRAGAALHADDTHVPVLDPGRGKTKTGRLWVLVRDERPWASRDPPAVSYLYSPDRKGEHAHRLLAGCRGFLHADAYAGFGKLYDPEPDTGRPRLTEVACWAHARRKIFEVHEETGSPAARAILDAIAELFAIEQEIAGRTPERRLAERQARSLPRLAQLKALMDTTLARISRKATLAGAIRYATTRWDALTLYATDGRLEMTNNAAERAIRPLALGRKNYLFAGSDEGGRRAAVFYTLITTAKLNSLDPHAWLADVIGRIADHPVNRIGELLPWNWTAERLQHAA